MSAQNEWVNIDTARDANGKLVAYLDMRWTQQDVVNNRYLIEARLQVGHVDPYYFNNFDTGWSLAGPSSASGTWRAGPAGWATKRLGTVTGWKGADNNGDVPQALRTASASVAAKPEAAAVSLSGSLDLPTIPRMSALTFPSGEWVTGGQALPYTVVPKITGAGVTHTLDWYAGGVQVAHQELGASLSGSWTPPVSLAQYTPTSASAPWLVTLWTILDGTVIGAVQVPWGFAVPAEIVPAVTSARVEPTSDVVPAEWGIFVQGLSGTDVHALADTSDAYGSYVSSWSVQGPDYTLMGTFAPDPGQTLWGVNVSTPGLLKTPGAHHVTVGVLDSRGRYGSATVDYQVEAWAPPSMVPGAAFRCAADGTPQFDGLYASVAVTGQTIADVAGHNSAVSSVLEWQERGDTSWTSAGSYTPGTPVVIGGAFDPTKAYLVRATVTDTLGGVGTYTWAVESADVTLDFPPGGDFVGMLGVVSEQVQADYPGGAVAVMGDLLVKGFNVWRPTYFVLSLAHTDLPTNVWTGIAATVAQKSGDLDGMQVSSTGQVDCSTIRPGKYLLVFVGRMVASDNYMLLSFFNGGAQIAEQYVVHPNIADSSVTYLSLVTLNSSVSAFQFGMYDYGSTGGINSGKVFAVWMGDDA